jgi:predicted RNA-binding Zn-ribbon protein involved in translation (DUF1610 family)/ElaB/YqjD/DUF883 family membrane-anchored ribosome-binding protein
MSDLESKFNSATDFLGVASLGGVVLSGILLFTPMRAMGYIGIGGGLGTFAASVVTRKKHLGVAKKCLNQLVDGYEVELRDRDGKILSLNGTVNDLQRTTQTLQNETARFPKLAEKIEFLTRQNESKDNIIEQVTNELERLISLARTAVEESLDEWETKLSSLVDTKKDQYPKLAERLNALLDEGQGKLKDYGDKLAQTPSKWDSLGNLLSLYYCLNDDLANIKTRMIQAIAKLTNQQTQHELQEVEEILEEWQTANLVPRDKLEHIIRNYEAALNEFRADFSNRFDTTHQFALALEGQTQEDDKFVQGILARMQELEQKIYQLSKPITYPGATRTDMRIANIVIAYFERYGIILDRAGSDYRGHEATLEFIPDRTGRLVLASELNEHSERLQGLTHVLNKPEFKLDGETGLMTLLVRWGNKPKADINDISKLWVPAAKFEQTLKGWSRVRLTGGSESGKSPTAENLAVAILKHRPGVPKLYNPQYDSVKNHWSIPVVGTSHSDSEKGIASLAKQVDARANGEELKDMFELSIFDEVDSTMSHTKGKKAVIGGNVNFIIKQASHQNLGAIFIGQNANVSEYPGMDRSDWNSAVNIHIGANAYDAITNSNRFTSEEVNKLKQTADKITEFCHDKNTELGLEKTDPNAYRFALVVEPNKKPYFIELPAFGTYTCDQLQQHQQSTPGVETATPDTSRQSLEALKTGISSASPLDIQSGYVGSGCPGCGSANRVKAGKYQLRQRYQCKDCGKRYTEGE